MRYIFYKIVELSFCVATAVVVGFVVVAPDDVVFVQRLCANDECQSFYPNFEPGTKIVFFRY